MAYVLCRYAWTHGITPRKQDIVPTPAAQTQHDHSQPTSDHASDDGSDVIATGGQRLTLSYRETRTSFTFRRLLHEPCKCGENITPFYVLFRIITRILWSIRGIKFRVVYISDYPAHCDSQKDSAPAVRVKDTKPEVGVPSRPEVPTSDSEAAQLESQHVHKVITVMTGSCKYKMIHENITSCAYYTGEYYENQYFA